MELGEKGIKMGGPSFDGNVDGEYTIDGSIIKIG